MFYLHNKEISFINHQNKHSSNTLSTGCDNSNITLFMVVFRLRQRSVKVRERLGLQNQLKYNQNCNVPECNIQIT